MAGIIHRVGIKAPVSKVYTAVSAIEGIAGWWTRDTAGDAKPGGTVHAHFRSSTGEEVGKMGVEIKKRDPNKYLQWRFNSGPEEWIGTEVTFDVSQQGDDTIVLFGHGNWREPVEFMAHCSMKWATFLLSLRQFVETGKGNPAPDDLKTDNWN